MTLPEPEVDLLESYRNGDAQAFRKLVDQYRDRIVQFFYRLCMDRDRAEDLAQDLFLKLMVGSGRYRAVGKMSVFIYRVATNLWIDRYRQALPRPRYHSYDQTGGVAGSGPRRVDFPSPEISPVQQLLQGEELSALRRAQSGLTESHRRVLELAIYQELPYARIGEILGIPVGTVKSRMHHAVATLKELLGAGEPRSGTAAPPASRRVGA